MIEGYNDFEKIKMIKCDFIFNLKYYFHYVINKRFYIPLNSGEILYVYLEKGKIMSFLIGKNIIIDGKKIFNLEFIYSFKKGYGKKILFNYINKNGIFNILYKKSSGFEFWDNVNLICENYGIILKDINDNIKFK